MINRNNYKSTWNELAVSSDASKHYVAGYTEESKLEKTASKIISVMQETVGISSNDKILEIGCGVGRVGKPLSDLCAEWIGCDISANMLSHARERLKGKGNVSFIELSTVGLAEIPDDSVDLVYCTVVFMHLYEWDRYKYVKEAFRVLKPGGRCFFDNFDITTDIGWGLFEEGFSIPMDQRPSHISMLSTGDELITYVKRAGFHEAKLHRWSSAWVGAYGLKPDSVNFTQ